GCGSQRPRGSALIESGRPWPTWCSLLRSLGTGEPSPNAAVSTPPANSPFASAVVSNAMPMAATLHKVLGSALLAPRALEFRAGPCPGGLLVEEVKMRGLGTFKFGWLAYFA